MTTPNEKTKALIHSAPRNDKPPGIIKPHVAARPKVKVTTAPKPASMPAGQK
jgi:hypothetical protein